MTARYDVVVIGAGLGGLTAAALLARAGRKVLVIERNNSVGGAASTYKVKDLFVEGALHETADPRDVLDPKHHVLSKLGVLDAVEWVRLPGLFEARGGPVGEPFVLPHGFPAVRSALAGRFPEASAGIDKVLGEMERLYAGVGALSAGREAFDNPATALRAIGKVLPSAMGWRRSTGDTFARAFGDNEGVKCALAANLAYYHDDPDSLWWLFYATAQGGYIGSGGVFIKHGSQRLSSALARVVRAAGGEVLLRRLATEIKLDADGRPRAVVHTHRDGSDRIEVETATIAGGAAPAILETMMPESARARFTAPYAQRRSSMSVFALTLGLSQPAATFGVRSYATFLLPKWMRSLADYKRSAGLLAEPPAGDMPIMAIADYSAIDSGFGAAPYPVSVFGPDRVENWTGLDQAAYESKRAAWLDAILRTLDSEFPGLAGSVVASTFNTASSMRNYLNAPGGAIYGFAPIPPRGPIWRGIVNTPRTALPGLFLASSYAATGGFTGAIIGGKSAAEAILGD